MLPPLPESSFTRHEPCPNCQASGGDRKGNNLARYTDGHGYCHACGHYVHSLAASDASRGTRIGAAPTFKGSLPLASADGFNESPNGETKMTEETGTNTKQRAPFNGLDVTIKALKPRGITIETCRHFGYGVGKYQGNACHIAPYFDAHGIPTGQHIRLENKDFRWLGEASALFGQHLWRHGGKRVVITEGEIDCLSISQLQGNKWPVVSVPNGAQSAAKYIKQNLEWLEAFDEIIFAFDMDEPGQEAAQACALLLTPGKAKIARLPAKDANECLQNGQGEALIRALWDAAPYRPDGIKSGADLWDDILKPPPAGFEIPYPELNAMLRGLRLGELYLFTAGSGIGKSTVVNEIAYHLKMNHSLPLGIMALEENPARNARRYLGIHLNKPLHLPEAHNSTSEAELRAAFDAVMGDSKWWIYDHFGSSDIDTLLGKLRYMAVGLGCKVIVLDHISIVVSGLDEVGGESERKTIDKLMTKLRQLIEETGIMVLAVVHLKRPDKGKSYNEGRPVSLTDLRGSGSLEQVSDVVVALERDQQGDEPNLSSIRLLKNRPMGICGPAGMVEYSQDTGRLLAADGATYGFTKENSNEQQQPNEKDF